MKVLFLAGWQRSGSTILANTLGQLAGYFSAGELYYLWDYVWHRNISCGCGRPFHDCPVWGAVVRTAYMRPDEVDADRMLAASKTAGRTRHFPIMMSAQFRNRILSHLADYRTSLSRLYEAIQEVTGCEVIVDSSKWPSYGLVLRSLAEVDLHVVHLVRDPRAVAHSWLRRKRLIDRGGNEYMHRSPMNSTIRWLAWNLASERLVSSVGDKSRLVRYEDFVVSPQRVIADLTRLCDEPASLSPSVMQGAVRLEPTHTVSGNPDRFRTGIVPIRADDEWRRGLSGRDKALVSAVAAPLLPRYGYPLRT